MIIDAMMYCTNFKNTSYNIYFLAIFCHKTVFSAYRIRCYISIFQLFTKNITLKVSTAVEAIKEGSVYTIDADACIDCGACEATCPNEAITEA